jgi:hypothetical protein
VTELGAIDNLEFLKYKPAKTNEIIRIAIITRIDSRMVNASIFGLFMVTIFAIYGLSNDTSL